MWCLRYIHTYGNESQIEYKHRITDKITSDYQIYNKISGVLKILDDKEWQSYMWNKIYRKKLFDNIQFPKGRGLGRRLIGYASYFSQCIIFNLYKFGVLLLFTS